MLLAGFLTLRRRISISVVAAVVLTVVVNGVATAKPNSPFRVAGGMFYPLNEVTGHGFAVRNYFEGPDFFATYQSLGGVEVLGPPLSRAWIGDDGFVYQLTQRVLMQWSPSEKRVRIAKIFELLSDQVFEEQLAGRHIPSVEESNADSDALDRAERLSWLTDQRIAETFANNPFGVPALEKSIEFFGLPMSRPVRIGPFIVQRFQRAALQHWVEQVEQGQPIGSVVLVNAGDVFREFAMPIDVRIKPHPAFEWRLWDARGDVPVESGWRLDAVTVRRYQADNELLRALALLELVEVNDVALKLASQKALTMEFTVMPMGTLAMFTSAPSVKVNERLRNEDSRILAAVLAHELRHFEDYMRGILVAGPTGCLDAEIRAVNREAETWTRLVGSRGLHPEPSRLAQIENYRATVYADGAEAIEGLVNRLYREACGHTGN
tara:strand:- start:769 stop:2076 length:1308 start_codon:yes stop_codon:yes gene_type:complete